MSTKILSQKVFKPVPPEKGSFPLDHTGVCKKFMVKYMICLHENGRDNSACRQFSKDYLACRMENNLMAQEEWINLGFNEESDMKEKNIEEKPTNS